MIWAPVRRGLALGVLAGLMAGVFAYLVGEPRLQDAIDLEQQQAALTFVPSHLGDVAVSRDAQRGGLFLGNALYGLAMGGVFGVLFLALRGRGRPRPDWVLATRLAAAAFVVLVVVPFLKYPANPPAVGDPATIGERTAFYLVLLVGGIFAAVAAARAGRAAERAGPEPWRRPVAALATFVALVGVLLVGLPGVDEVPSGFPATLLWEFRLSSLGTQATFWTVLGVGFGILSDRATRTA